MTLRMTHALLVPTAIVFTGTLLQVAALFPSTAAKLIINSSEGGPEADQALQLLAAAGYASAVKLEGGYEGWGKVTWAFWGVRGS